MAYSGINAHSRVLRYLTGIEMRVNGWCDSPAGPKRLDRVARFRRMQAIWAGDAFLQNGAAGANGAGKLQAVLSAVIACAWLRITRDN